MSENPGSEHAVTGTAWRAFREWAVVIIIALTAAMVVRTWVLQQYYISGPSMQPSFQPNDRVLVNKLSYRFGTPKRGHVIVFDRLTTNGGRVKHDDLIKRVVGLPGETVRIEDCALYVNDAVVPEPYLVADGDEGGVACAGGDFAPVEVPSGQYFVLGDNRTQSSDSRFFGPVPERDIVGRAFAVVWPLGSARFV